METGNFRRVCPVIGRDISEQRKAEGSFRIQLRMRGEQRSTIRYFLCETHMDALLKAMSDAFEQWERRRNGQRKD